MQVRRNTELHSNCPRYPVFMWWHIMFTSLAISSASLPLSFIVYLSHKQTNINMTVRRSTCNVFIFTNFN